MDTRDRLVVVSATALADHLDLCSRAAAVLGSMDERLADAFRGSTAELARGSVLEPA